MKTEIRGRGRPPLPDGEALDARISVRLSADEAALLDQLADVLDTDRAGAMREALRALAARKVRS